MNDVERFPGGVMKVLMMWIFCGSVVDVFWMQIFFSLSHLELKSVKSQCARGKSSLAFKPKSIQKCFNGKKLFKNVTLQILNFILLS